MNWFQQQQKRRHIRGPTSVLPLPLSPVTKMACGVRLRLIELYALATTAEHSHCEQHELVLKEANLLCRKRAVTALRRSRP